MILFENETDVPEPQDVDSVARNLMVFDDLMLERQNKCKSYYVRGRHINFDCFYVTQNYFNLPRRTIRENANFLRLFKKTLRIWNMFTDITVQIFQ